MTLGSFPASWKMVPILECESASEFLYSSHTRRKKTDLQFQMMTIYYTIESPRNRDYWRYPQFKHTVKPQDDIVGYYALKQDFKYVVLRNDFTLTLENKSLRIEQCSLAPILSGAIGKSNKTGHGSPTSENVQLYQR